MDEPAIQAKRDRMSHARAVAASNRAARKSAAAGGIAESKMRINDEPKPDNIKSNTILSGRAATRAPIHEPTRAPLRSSGKSEAIGRNGEMLSRKRTATGDIFAIDPNLIPPGWEYQWCAVTVVGNSEILLDQNLMYAENGWRAVPADRYPGKFMPVGYKGSIVRGGQLLMERPKSLCDEARAEDVNAARQLISDRNESLKLSSVKKQMADGFEMSGKYEGTGGNIRMSIDPALDVPAPSRRLAESE